MEIKVVGIKFKPVGKIYSFSPKNYELKLGDGVIVETERGIEYGEVVVGEKLVKKEEIIGELKKVIRPAVDKDYEVLERNNKLAIEHAKVAKEQIKKMKLQMKLIDAEFTFDSSKIIFTFTAEGRVDFRELVRELANKLKLRIELRQVGARDASKIIGGLGPCGRAICCANHMREFNKVSIKMAKTQGLALNPSKINGVCGRLMCCLAYENDFYAEASKGMPKVGKKVTTPDGEGIAVYNNLLKQIVTVRFFTGDGPPTTTEYPASEVKRLFVDNNQNQKKKQDENKKQSDNKHVGNKKCDSCPKKELADEKSLEQTIKNGQFEPKKK
jgi:cell fate regulator YaaT (PSP1 superfamily)